MLSEWMSGVPDDFETEWMLVPCPKGKRTLVIASGVRCQVLKFGEYFSIICKDTLTVFDLIGAWGAYVILFSTSSAKR